MSISVGEPRPSLAMALFGAVAALLGLSLFSCNRNGAVPGNAVNVAKSGPPAGPPFFEDVTALTGIDFKYQNGQEAGHYAILESLGGGIGLIDFDGDGLLDIFIPGGGYYDGPDKQTIKGHPCKLYKNLGNFKFKDVTAEVGLEREWPYAHGCAVGDYDNDGWPDLLVTGWGGTLLFHNVAVDPGDPKKGRKFVEIPNKVCGLTDNRWSTSAAWADFDGDGFADLYVCHYVDWSFDNNPKCGGYKADIKRDVCPPGQFKGLPHVIYRNNRDGTFTDMSKKANLRQMSAKAGEDAGKGLGVVVADLNGDGRPDIYVANDTVDNFLYINRGNFEFEEVGMLKGVARDENGVPNGSMGVDVGDYNRTGLASLFVTNYENENHALYKNLGKNDLFLFSTTTAGIAAIGQRFVGWGTSFIDVDHDGWLDIVIINGHVIRHPAVAGVNQRPVLFRNNGNGKFDDVSARSGAFFNSEICGRGMAVGDLDNDGWTDCVISVLNDRVVVLRGIGGRHPKANHWLGIELAGKKNRNLVGAKISVEVDGHTLTSFVKSGASYGSAHDPRHLFGLGRATKIGRVTVTWTAGQSQSWDGAELTADRYWRLVEGEKAPLGK